MLDLSHYKSASQRARVFSEDWIESNFQCPRCAGHLKRTPNNTSAKDFVCDRCTYGFEVKSKRGLFGGHVVDGAYQTMLTAVRSGTGSHLVLLSYTLDYQVREVITVPRRFLVEEIVIPRKPLGSHCRRAGWQGCNLNIGMLPPDGRIVCFANFEKLPVDKIKAAWDRTAFLDDYSSSTRGWLAVTMGLIRRLAKDQFNLTDLYGLEAEASKIFPKNTHIRAKMRQQLQRLRDIGWLRFEGKGNYSITS